jgi:hypothetical protein
MRVPGVLWGGTGTLGAQGRVPADGGRGEKLPHADGVTGMCATAGLARPCIILAGNSGRGTSSTPPLSPWERERVRVPQGAKFA